MANEGLFKSPTNSKDRDHNKPGVVIDGGSRTDTLFSPRFRSVAEMAGWDEEALLIASLIVEDTPERQSKQKKRPDLSNFRTPPSNSRRKRRAQRRSPTSSMPVVVLNLEDDEPTKEDEIGQNLSEPKIVETEQKKTDKDESDAQRSTDSSSSSTIPCMDRLREELSCAICLEICFEPSTTPCGHSFCKKCLRSAADKCGKKCPKCRQLISNGRSCTVNTVLWNTIQLLFPQEIEARKASGALNPRQARRRSPVRVNRCYNNGRNRNVELLNSPEAEISSPRRSSRRRSVNVRPSVMLRRAEDDAAVRRRRNELPSQAEDAALALRLQRQEFLEVFRGSHEQQHYRSSLQLATENLRAMVTRATSFRNRGRTTT